MQLSFKAPLNYFTISFVLFFFFNLFKFLLPTDTDKKSANNDRLLSRKIAVG